MAAVPAKGSPLKSKKVLIVAALALLLVGYLYFRSRSATPGAVSSVPNGSAVPQSASDAAGQSTDQSSADLLAALAGENQQLMKSFLDSSSGLVSLAGSSLGAPFGSSTAGEPAGTSGFASTTSVPFDDSSSFVPTGTLAGSDPIASSLTESTSGPLGVNIPSEADLQSVAAAGSVPSSAFQTPGSDPNANSGSVFGVNIPSQSDLQSVATAAAAGSDVSAAFSGSQSYTPYDEAPPTVTSHEQALQAGTGHGQLAD